MMKALKLIIIVATFLIGGITFMGCEKSRASGSSETHEDERTADSNEKQISDSIMNEINSCIDQLARSQESNERIIDELKNELSNQKETYRLYGFVLCGVFVVIIVAIIMFVTLVKYHNNVQKQVNRYGKCIDDLCKKVCALEQKLTIVSSRPKTPNSGLHSNEYTLLASRIEKLERQYEQTVLNPTTDAPIPINTDIGQKSNEQNGYFNLPIQMSLTEAYFRHFYKSRDSESRFSANVSDGKAEFRPLEEASYFNDIKSSDAIRLSLEFQGCALSEATQMKVLTPGVAKLEDGRWVIKKKAFIILIR